MSEPSGPAQYPSQPPGSYPPSGGYLPPGYGMSPPPGSYPPAGGPPAPRRGTPWWLIGSVTAVVLLLVACGGGFVGWKAFVGFGVGSDLEEYREAVQNSELPDDVKQRLSRRLDTLRDQARKKPPSFFAWLQHDERLDAITADGVTPDEVPQIELVLERIEQQVK